MKRPQPWRTLRGRLAGAMAVVFVLAVAASALVDRMQAPPPASPAGARPGALESEPYQDGLVLAAFTLPALLAIWLVSSWSLRPLLRASAEAQGVGPLQPGARISRTGLPAEVTPLVDAVNGALDRMAQAFEAERRFTENAAHELRTPLAVLHLRLQRARQAQAAGRHDVDWGAIDADVARMNRLVGQLLDLARKQNAGGAAANGVVNVARVAREACAATLPLAEAQGRAITVHMPGSLLVRGGADDLRDALCNLLENAVLHGRGRVALQAGLGESGVVVSVTDEGPGVAAGQELAVFERFRKDNRSSGTGLGLAIVQEVARAHGGRVRFVAGVGRVEVWLPRVEASAGGDEAPTPAPPPLGR